MAKKKQKKKPLHHVWEVISLLNSREKRSLWVVFFSAVAMALIQIIGVGSVMPFMAVAANPERIQTNKYLRWAYETFGFSSQTRFLIALGVGVLVFLVFTNLAQVFLHYIKIRFTSMRCFSLGRRLMEHYLRMPYPFFLQRNSYEFVKNIRGEISQIVNGTLIQFIDLLTKFIQVSLLTLFLFLVNPINTLLILTALVTLYSAAYVLIRGKLKQLGEERFTLNISQARAVAEAFWGIKDVKLLGVERVFLKEFSVPAKKLARNKSTQEILGDVPQFMLETIAFSSIMVFVLTAIIRSGSFADAAASVTLYAYAGYRMIPAVQGLFKAITKLRYGTHTAHKMIEEFQTVEGAPQLSPESRKVLPFQNCIEISNMGFIYPKSEMPVLYDIDIEIPVNSSVGFAGKTGAGKTTLVDIILGLHRPQYGKIIVDGVSVSDDNLPGWQSNLGYVPQAIYLSNDSLAANVAFGIPKDQIDMEAVRRAVHLAQLEEFVENELPQKYDTFVGERGVRLSGGERQRTGIARALYRNPSVLVLDEATSSLDDHTEKAVMKAIDSLMGVKTIIMIAHRLSTLEKCDKIYLLEKGRIVDSGSYQELVDRNPYFTK